MPSHSNPNAPIARCRSAAEVAAAETHLRCRDGTGRGADNEVGSFGHIEASFGQAGDDTDLPRISGSPTATEDQGNVVGDLRLRRSSHRARRERLRFAPGRREQFVKLRHFLVPFMGIRGAGTQGPTTTKL